MVKTTGKFLRVLLLALLVLSLSAALFACGETGTDESCTEHVDADKNGKCDQCGADVKVDPCTEHVDADKNGKCDKCGATVEDPSCEHVDEDDDGYCDKCEEAYCVNHKDVNHDGKCDKCRADVKVDPCTEHVDANKDGKCDKCGADVKVDPCTDHVDANQDGKCDKCGADVKVDPCTEHVDADKDGKCDKCGATVQAGPCTEHVDKNKDGKCDKCKEVLYNVEPIEFSNSSKAPTSLPMSDKAIEGEFVADFEDADNYFQPKISGSTVTEDSYKFTTSTSGASKVEIANGTSGSKGLNIYNTKGVDAGMWTDFYVKNRVDARNYTGVIFYVDVSKITLKNTAYMTDPNIVQQYAGMSVTLVLSDKEGNEMTAENWQVSAANGYASWKNKAIHTISGYYYDTATKEWVRTENAFRDKTIMVLPSGFQGYVYVPFTSYFDAGSGAYAMTEALASGEAFVTKIVVHTGGYKTSEPSTTYTTVDDICLVREAGSDPRSAYVSPEDEQEIIRVEPGKETATVKFVIGRNDVGFSDVTYTYSVGKKIYSQDIPKLARVSGSYCFDCWCSDMNGRYPLNPDGYTVTGNVTFYADWYSTESGLYSSDAMGIVYKEGGSYNLPKGKIIFYGASNFTKWTTLPADFKAGSPSYDVLNHGIGGATDRSLLENIFRLVIRYEPKAVVIQCSNNDVGKYDDETCKQTKQQLYDIIHNWLPNTDILFVCHMPLPGRANFWRDSNRLQNLNVWMKEFCDTHDRCYYLDVFDDIKEIALKKLDGIDDSYFLPGDNSHMSAKGQAIFCAALKREMMKAL